MLDDHELKTGERIYLQPSGDLENIAVHLQRYRFALAHSGPNDLVLDAACGSGYGTQLLSTVASHVIGVDISDHALAYARLNHLSDGVEFRHADLNRPLDLPSGSLDLVVSFETLEHVRNPSALLSEFARVLKPGGRLIVSTPDRDIYSTAMRYRNEFHVSELSKAEFVRSISNGFIIDRLYGQLQYRVRRWAFPLLWLARADRHNFRLRMFSRLASMRWLRARIRPVRAGTSEMKIEPTDSGSPSSHVFLIAVAQKPSR